MAPATWKDCFDYAIRLSRYGGYLPFAPQTRRNRIISRTQLFIQFLLTIRLIMTVIDQAKGNIMSVIFMIVQLDTYAKVFQITRDAKKFEDYFSDIDDFLRDNEVNPVTGRVNHFMEIWRRKSPGKTAEYLLYLILSLLLVWYWATLYSVYFSVETARPFYWTPFHKSAYARWFFALQEIVPGTILLYTLWYINMLFTSLTIFHYAQLCYLAEMFSSTVQENFFTEANVARCIKIHQQVLDSVYKVTYLLGFHALASYFSLIAYFMFCVALLLFENVSPNESQKILCFVLGIFNMIEFGYNCRIADMWDDAHSKLRDIIFTNHLMDNHQWVLSTYKIFMQRTNKPLIFKGYHFVVLNSTTFRVLLTNIFSLYTSLRSILTSKTVED